MGVFLELQARLVGFYPLSFDNHIQPIRSREVFARLQTGCRRANRSAKARTIPLTLFSESPLQAVSFAIVQLPPLPRQALARFYACLPITSKLSTDSVELIRF
jgi:hypothetical protein